MIRDAVVVVGVSVVAYVVLRLIRGTDPGDGVAPGPVPARPGPGDRPDEWVLVGGERLRGVHRVERCRPPCTIHAPSDHHMSTWAQHWRDDRSLMERVCPHGVGHPDPDHWPYFGQDLTHGCDGCCTPPDPSPGSPPATTGTSSHT